VLLSSDSAAGAGAKSVFDFAPLALQATPAADGKILCKQ